MADVIYKKGLKKNIPDEIVDGQILVTTDTGEMYVDTLNDETNQLERKNISKTQIQIITWGDED